MECCEEYFGNQLQISNQLLTSSTEAHETELKMTQKLFHQHDIDSWVIWQMGIHFQKWHHTHFFKWEVPNI